MLKERIHTLQLLVSPGVSFSANPLREVSPLTAAGVFLICDYTTTSSTTTGITATTTTTTDTTTTTTTAAAATTTITTTIPLVLLGQRRSKHSSSDMYWVTLGGNSEVKYDNNLFQTAHREIFEETNGKIKLFGTLSTAPYHDLVRENHVFRQYFLKLDSCMNSTELYNIDIPAELRYN